MPEGCRATGEALIVSKTPDVCLTPVGSSVQPVPYNIWARMDQSQRTADTVSFTSMPVFHTNSRVPQVIGNEAGQIGGVVSGVNKGSCKPITFSDTVYVEGECVVRHDSDMEMNCQGLDGSGNTIGSVTYVKVQQTAYVTEDGNIVRTERHSTIDEEGNQIIEERTVEYDPDGNVISASRGTQVTTPGGDMTATLDKWSAGPGYRLSEDGNLAKIPSRSGIERTGNLEFSDMPHIQFGEPEVRDPGITPHIGPISTEAEIPDGVPPSDWGQEPVPVPDVLDEEEVALLEELDALDKELIWEGAKLAVDTAGTIDPTPISDVASAAMSLSEGDYFGAILAGISIIPYVGDAVGKPVKIGRIAKKIAKLKKKIAKIEKRLDRLRKAKKIEKPPSDTGYVKVTKPEPPKGKPSAAKGGAEHANRPQKAKKERREKVGDSSKAERHGDQGRAMEKAEKKIADLEKQLEGATKKEKKKIKQKIKNIREDAQRKKKGETHHRK